MSTLMNGSDKEHQVLTRIKGIGPVKQRWLKNSLKISTIRDLATCSVEQIESRLKAQGQTFSHSEIKGWIEQAQKLIEAEPSAQEILEAPQLTSNSKSLQLGIEENNHWKSFASFRIEFQSRKLDEKLEERTIIHYLEANQNKIWRDIKPEQIEQWMQEQMQAAIPQSEAKNNIAAPPITIEITQILAFQPPKSERAMVVDQNNRLFPSTINSGEPFMLVVAFKIMGLNEDSFNQQKLTYQAQFYGRNRSTGSIIHLGDTMPESLESGLAFYTTRLPEITLDSGIYRLQGLVKVQGILANPGCFEIPLLQVV
jgi:hypothetical protein